MAGFYFLTEFLEKGRKLPELVFTLAAFMHARPENFIFAALIFTQIGRKIVKSPTLTFLGGINWVVKIFEYWRGLSKDWLPLVSFRFQLLAKSITKIFMSFVNPTTFNLPLFIFALYGEYMLVRKGRYFLAFIPLIGIFIFIIKPLHPYSRYFIGYFSLWLLSGYEGIKSYRPKKWFLLLSLVPFAFITPSTSPLFQEYGVIKDNIPTILSLSQTRGLPVVSYFHRLFKNWNSYAIMDDFLYPPGQYILISPLSHHYLVFQEHCNISSLTSVQNVEVYLISCNRTAVPNAR